MRRGSRGEETLAHRFFVTLVAACVIVAVFVMVVASVVYQRAVIDEEHQRLASECSSIAAVLDASDDDASIVESLAVGGVRVTLIAADGTVMYDSEADAATMPNHAQRLEVALALTNGEGSSERRSATVDRVSVYEARRLASGDVLRISTDRLTAMALVGRDVWVLVGVIAVVVAASWYISRRLSDAIVQPILSIDPATSHSIAPYVELKPLVHHLNDQHRELVGRMKEIEDADDMRREFTANVTHELKTPIASISAASELMRSGMVRDKDVPDFANRIYGDAQRLSSLVSDILTLSKLDESERAGDQALFGEKEPVDLMAIVADVVSRQEPRAMAADVRIDLQGIPTMLMGNPKLLDELASNLIGNAIRYNHPGGSVRVWVLPKGDAPCLRVDDTGIGIPAAEQEKVFERFYRVDKGRSRERGGTGLGLAIVKHAAAFHGATVSLKSTLGEGTSVTVTFPVR